MSMRALNRHSTRDSYHLWSPYSGIMVSCPAFLQTANSDMHAPTYTEDCSLPSNVSGYSAVNNIREVAHTFGGVKLFKTYFHWSEQLSPQYSKFRSELQSSGVSLIDCPLSGRKYVGRKMILGVSQSKSSFIDLVYHANSSGYADLRH